MESGLKRVTQANLVNIPSGNVGFRSFHHVDEDFPLDGRQKVQTRGICRMGRRFRRGMIPTPCIVGIDLNPIIKRKLILPIEAYTPDSRTAIWADLISFFEFFLDAGPIPSAKNEVGLTG
jgi:hypothetical protein